MTEQIFQEKWQATGFDKPTPIQEQTRPLILDGKDVVGVSPTGSGKTLAYALPLIEQVEDNDELQVMVILPSQELAHQVGDVMREWAQVRGLRLQTLAGGANVKRQIDRLKKKPQIIVGTAGRINELANKRKVKMHQLKAIVFDEADYLVQPEYHRDVQDLVKRAPNDRQLLFFTATADQKDLSRTIDKLFDIDPSWVDVSQETQASTANILHGYILGEARKRSEVMRRLGNIPGMQALVFINKVEELKDLEEKLLFEGIPVVSLSGSDHANVRKLAVDGFKRGQATFLLTTDVMARGMDFADLPVVIQYDVPLTQDQYTHRAGRTGRMGKDGIVISLVDDRQLRNLKQHAPVSPVELEVRANQLIEK